MLEVLQGDPGRVYRYLVSLPAATAADVAAALTLEPGRSRELLDTLVEAGLVVRDDERYVARSPSSGLRSELLAREEDLRGLRETVDQLAAAYARAAEFRDSGVELVSGRSAIQERVLALQYEAETEYLALVKSRHVAVEPGESPVLKAEHVRAVFEMDLLQNQRFRELVRDKTKPNYENRVYPGVPLRLAIADRERAVVGIRPADDSPLALFVQNESLILALRTYFETIWAAAAPMLLAREGDPAEWTEVQPHRLSERERELVSMLLSGLTNEAIAAHWGISRRSVVRQVQELMTRTGSTSRVHLGWEAHRRGWLDG